MEKPKSAAAVSSTLMAVTLPVPSLRVSASLISAETTVPTAIIMDITPAYETGTPNCTYMLGQAEPSSASGRPRLMNAR